MSDPEDVYARLAQFVATNRVILHLGAHKTATTYVQKMLDLNRADLAERGVGLVLPRDIRAKSNPDLSQAPITDRLRAAFAAALDQPGLKRLVFSEEGLLGAPRKNLARGDLYPGLADNLTVLPKLLDHPNVFVMFGVRDYGPYFSSCVTTALRRGHRFDRRSLRARLLLAPRGWENVVADLAAYLPNANLMLWRYEEHVDALGAVLDAMAGTEVRVGNETLFPTLSKIAVTIATALPEDLNGPDRRKAIKAAEAAHPITDQNPRFTLWSDEETALLRERYDVDWQSVTQRWPGAILHKGQPIRL